MTANRYSFVCNNGCGVCVPKVVPFEYSRTETLAGELLESKVRPKVVSACCGQEVAVYDNAADNWIDGEVVFKAAAPSQPEGAEGEPLMMKKEVEAALTFALWHHQGGSSKVGQPIRKMLVMGEHARLTEGQVEQAKRVQAAFAAAGAAAPDEGEARGIDLAARYVEKLRDGYVSEHSSYDPDTGATEFSEAGQEYVSTLDELAEGIRALSAPKGEEPSHG